MDAAISRPSVGTRAAGSLSRKTRENDGGAGGLDRLSAGLVMFRVYVCGELESRVAVQGGNGDGRAVRLTIPARAEYVGLSRLALSGLARLGSFSDEVLGDL